MKALTVHNVEITTARVEVQTLSISGKQVTLALFRQLPEFMWLDRDANPRGPAWGRVNYCPGAACAAQFVGDGWNGRERNGWHMHLVWQLGSELRRTPMTPDPAFPREARDWSMERADAFRERWTSAYELARQLPQLFIAV